MRLSLWMILDYLQEYNPTAYINDGKPEISMSRILSSELHPGGSILYLAKSEDYFGFPENKVLCVHNRDYLLLDSDDISEVFNRILDCFEFYTHWEDSCIEIIRQNGTLRELFDASQEIFQGLLTLTDTSLIVLEIDSRQPPADLSAEESRAFEYNDQTKESRVMALTDVKFARSLRQIYNPTGKAYLSYNPSLNMPVAVRNINKDGAVWGYLSELFFRSEPTKGQLQLLEAFGSILESWEMNQAAEGLALPGIDMAFRKLLSGEDGPEVYDPLSVSLENLGWLPECRKQLYIIRSQTDDVGILPAVNSLLSQLTGTVCIRESGNLILLVNQELFSARNNMDQLRSTLRDAGCFAVESSPFTNIRLIRSLLSLSRIAIEYCSRKGGEIYASQDYFIDHLTAILSKEGGISFEHPAVLQLAEYDAENNTQLAYTLYRFLLFERRYDHVAKELFVHRNTVQYRVEKAIELTSIDLDEVRQRLYLLLALHMHFNRR